MAATAYAPRVTDRGHRFLSHARGVVYLNSTLFTFPFVHEAPVDQEHLPAVLVPPLAVMTARRSATLAVFGSPPGTL